MRKKLETFFNNKTMVSRNLNSILAALFMHVSIISKNYYKDVFMCKHTHVFVLLTAGVVKCFVSALNNVIVVEEKLRDSKHGCYFITCRLNCFDFIL